MSLYHDASDHEGDDDRDADDPWDEPVDCRACGRIHELQSSYFCPSCKAGGYCARCWPDAHVCSWRKADGEEAKRG